MKTLGEFEYLILLSLLRLGEDAYGVSIRREIEERTARQVSTGALYTTLARLRRKGLVRTFLGEPTRERGGRRKKHYCLETAGRRALAHTHQSIRRMTEDLEDELASLVRSSRVQP